MVETDLVGRLTDSIRTYRRRVVIIGDAITDVWVRGSMEPSQDGCEKFVQVGEAVSVPGGAANAYKCLAHWDTKADLIALAEVDRPVKTRFVDAEGRIVFRWDDETAPVQLENWKYCHALEMVGCAGGVLLSDYDKGALPREFIRQIADLCTRRGIPCVADCKREPGVYTGCVLKCNQDYQHDNNNRLADLVYNVERGQRLVVTYGPISPIVWDGAGPLGLGYDLPRVRCVNHVGAGDCFAAHLALALTNGFSLKDAAALAHSAGRVYVQHPYNRAPHPTEVMADLSVASA